MLYEPFIKQLLKFINLSNFIMTIQTKFIDELHIIF